MTKQEYNTTVDAYADGLYRFVLKQIRDKDLANDIMQDTYEKVWIKHQSIDVDKAKSYLYTTAYRTMIDETRKQKKVDKTIEVKEIELGYENRNHDLKKVIDQALVRLPALQQSLILLRDYEGYSYEQIAEITALTASQVKVYIYRARLALREYIGKLENVL
jgi:RNA polymerase sigma factor (sigma-70 family)